MEYNELIADLAKRHNVEDLVAIDRAAALDIDFDEGLHPRHRVQIRRFHRRPGVTARKVHRGVA